MSTYISIKKTQSEFKFQKYTSKKYSERFDLHLTVLNCQIAYYLFPLGAEPAAGFAILSRMEVSASIFFIL